MNSNISNKRFFKRLDDDPSSATENKSSSTQKGLKISEITMKKKSETRCGNKWVDLPEYAMLRRVNTTGSNLSKQSIIKINKNLTINDDIQKKNEDRNSKKLVSLMIPAKVDNNLNRMQKTIDNNIVNIKRKLENNSQIKCATSGKAVIGTDISQKQIEKTSNLQKNQEENTIKNNRYNVRKLPAENSNTVQKKTEISVVAQEKTGKEISNINTQQKKTESKDKPNEAPSNETTYKSQKGSHVRRKSIVRSKVKSKSFVWKDLMATSNKPKWKDIMKSSRKFKVSVSVMQILHDGELKLTAYANTKNSIETYLAKHANLVVQLINIIEDTKSLAVCTSAINALHQICVKSHLFNRNRNIDVMDYLRSSRNFVILINSVYSMNKKFNDLAKYNADKADLYNKLFQIINVFSESAECRKRVKKVTKETALFMCILLKEHKEKDLLINLLIVFKLICSARRVCHFLSCKFFYDSLCASYKLTQKLITIVSILNLMAKHKVALQFMSQHDHIISLLLEFVNYKSKAPISKTAVLTILHKIASTEAGLKILSKTAYYNKLHSFFLKNKAEDEVECRVKAYSILSLCTNKSVLTLAKLCQNLNLPDSVVKCMDYTKDLCDSDADDESDEDSSETDESDEGSSFKLSDSSKRMYIEPIVDMEPISGMKAFFRELYTCTISEIPEFRIYNGIGFFTDKKTIEGRVRRLSNINKLAFPDAAMLMATPENRLNSVHRFPTEYLVNKLKPKESSGRIFYAPQVVYNLDTLYKTQEPIDIPQFNTFVPQTSPDVEHSDVLKFESRFESGNLRRAIRVDKLEYDLILSPDTSTSKGYQWFYFQVSNMTAKEKYTFNIINFTKTRHLYNDGMQPLFFSATNYKLSGVGWKRAGERVVYYGNQYTNKSGKVQYKTLSFCLTFPYTCDYVYIAYHYPYTYTRLMVALSPFMTNRSNIIFSRMDKLCNTVNNANEVPLLTITASLDSPTSYKIPFRKRPIIFITARVHPGETNASWIMEGLFNFLANANDLRAMAAREYFIFKIVPMLNPEGVIYGNTRRGLIGMDLNRCWARPNKNMCPEIYYAKRLVEFAKREIGQPIAAYIDIHGHSQEKCFFFYGCNPKNSWNSKDRRRGDWIETLELIPQTIQKLNPNIQLSSCNYDVKRSRESTGRVVMWRQFGITQSYTLECTYSEGYRKQSMNTRMLAEIGESVVVAFGKIAEALYKSKKSLPAFGLDYGNMDNWSSQTSQAGPSAQTLNAVASNNNTVYLNRNQYVHYFFRF